MSTDDFDAPNPFLGETSTIQVTERPVAEQRRLNEVPTQRDATPES